MEKEETLHYLKVLKNGGSFFQKEIRDALDEAIKKFEGGK